MRIEQMQKQEGSQQVFESAVTTCRGNILALDAAIAANGGEVPPAARDALAALEARVQGNYYESNH